MRPAVPWLVALVAATSSGCLEEPSPREGAGYVVESVAADVDAVRIAWLYPVPDEQTAFAVRAHLSGRVPLDDGAFDLDALLASTAGADPPTRRCLDSLYGPRIDDPAATVGEETGVAIGGIVATAGEPADDIVDARTLSTLVVAHALDVAVVWSAEDVPRGSIMGERLESSLRAGLQLARLRPCRVPVECQGVEDVASLPDGRADRDLCLDPWPDDGLVLLQASTLGR